MDTVQRMETIETFRFKRNTIEQAGRQVGQRGGGDAHG